MPDNVPRIDPRDAMAAVRNGALLVCAYEDPAAFLRLKLAGAISIQDFRKMSGGLPKDREIIFYCN